MARNNDETQKGVTSIVPQRNNGPVVSFVGRTRTGNGLQAADGWIGWSPPNQALLTISDAVTPQVQIHNAAQ